MKQTRGKFGLGAKMALIWSKMSTGLPVEVNPSRTPSCVSLPRDDGLAAPSCDCSQPPLLRRGCPCRPPSLHGIVLLLLSTTDSPLSTNQIWSSTKRANAHISYYRLSIDIHRWTTSWFLLKKQCRDGWLFKERKGGGQEGSRRT